MKQLRIYKVIYSTGKTQYNIKDERGKVKVFSSIPEVGEELKKTLKEVWGPKEEEIRIHLKPLCDFEIVRGALARRCVKLSRTEAQALLKSLEFSEKELEEILQVVFEK